MSAGRVNASKSFGEGRNRPRTRKHRRQPRLELLEDRQLLSLPGTVYFDFGTATSTLTPGYTKVTSSTTYSPALGYGWSSGTIGERDRGKPAWSDQSAFNFTTDGSFAVDLANGTYVVTLTSGDSLVMHDQEGIFLQGSQVDTITTAANQFVTRAYIARVTDGRLVLGLKDLGGTDPNCMINSLQIQFASSSTSGTTSARNFDFGTATSALTPGYIKATSSTTYSPALGYGWSSGTVGERDRGKPAWSDQSAFNFTTDGTFTTDLANGIYAVTLTTGDSLAMHDQQGIFLQGLQVDTISTATNQFVTRTYIARVTGGRLVLGLKDLGGTDPNCMINSLQIQFVSSSTSDRNFDFGTATSALTPGYIKATSSTDYSPALGYGWSSGTIGERDRGKPAGSDQSAFNFTTNGTFVVDLANGTYAVTLTSGDLLAMHDQQGIFLQGLQVDTITTAVNQFVTRTYTAQVIDGQLELGLVDLGGTDPNCMINSLQIQFVSSSTTSSTIAYNFDFGTATSTLTPGYTKAISLTQYSSLLGYGWSAGTVGERDRGKPTGSDQSAFNFTTNGTFVVDLANGTYAVTLTTGDSLAMHDQQGIFLQGSQVDTITTGVNQFVTRTYIARVTGGRLVLGLRDLGGTDPNCVINSLQIQFVSSSTTSSTIAYNFDFGTDASTLTSGYARTTSSTDYSSLLGYGWSAGTVGERDRGKPTGSDQSAFNFTTNGTFVVDLANGTYAVTLTSGDSLVMHDQEGIFLQGSQVDTISTRAGQFVTRTYAARVTDGRLVLDLVDLGGLDPNCVINSLQIQFVSGRTVQIDQSWLQQRGPGPYSLDQANTTYVLQTDVTVSGTAFIINSDHVTLDLNGHTITYDNSAPIAVPNAGFETGNLTGWNTSGAPSAKVVPSINGMWGNSMLQLSNITSTQSIISSNVKIPLANVQYAATITPKSNSADTTVTITVIDAVTGAVLGVTNSSDPSRGFSPVVTFTPTTTNPIRLRITVTPAAGNTDTVDLDYAAVMRSNVDGVLQGSTVVCPSFTLKNGTVTQGQGNSYASSPLQYGAAGLVVDGVKMMASGLDTCLIDATWAQNTTIKNSTLIGNLDRISNRMLLLGGINLANVTGTVDVENNNISGTMDTGITFYRREADGGSVKILNNTIKINSLSTDGYGIVFENMASNFEIGYNTIVPVNGRGILIDNTAINGSIHDNQVEAREKPNLEFGATSMEATALRLRSYNNPQKNIAIYNNTFAAYTGAGADWAAIGARIMEQNAHGENMGSNITFTNNTFKAIVTSLDPTLSSPFHSQAWALSIANVDAGTGLKFVGNTFVSNAVSINLGDNDSWSQNNSGILFVGNTIAKSTEGVSMPYNSIVAGDWNNGVSDIRFIDTKYANGASASSMVFYGARPKDVEFGRLLSLSLVDSRSTPLAAATVKILNQSGAVVFTGTTDGKGLLQNIPLVTSSVAQTTADPGDLATATANQFTLIATKGGLTLKKTISLTSDQSLKLQL
jgi:fibronectin type 3 domain-containing protein